jgi:hypothetical protein
MSASKKARNSAAKKHSPSLTLKTKPVPVKQIPSLTGNAPVLKLHGHWLVADHDDIENPKEVRAREVDDDVPFAKGPLLTYYCWHCNVRHTFHVNDKIKEEDTLMSSLEVPNSGSPGFSSLATNEFDRDTIGDRPRKQRKTIIDSSSESECSDDSSSPTIDYTQDAMVCCANYRCSLPRTEGGMIACFDCKKFYHANVCGETVTLPCKFTRVLKTRYICFQCYHLCCSGRDVCSHPGNPRGRVMCHSCNHLFHSSGCGGDLVTVESDDPRKGFQEVLMCYQCLMKHEIQCMRLRDKKCTAKSKITKALCDNDGKENACSGGHVVSV